ncbi:MAG: STAS/SEC14 domain-containing protein [Bacteroidia bacterium]|nr:STAS/SEC14 domain-containing protein [Bacteroidia bacterium]
MTFLKPIKLSKGHASLIEPGLVCNHIEEGIVIEVEDVKAFKQANETLAEGKPYAVLVEVEELVAVSRESRELTASKDFKRYTIAEAFVISSLGHKIIADFYMQVNKPHILTKIFNDREKALKWLKQCMQDYISGTA